MVVVIDDTSEQIQALPVCDWCGAPLPCVGTYAGAPVHRHLDPTECDRIFKARLMDIGQLQTVAKECLAALEQYELCEGGHWDRDPVSGDTVYGYIHASAVQEKLVTKLRAALLE